jgi:hypothetical protein
MMNTQTQAIALTDADLDAVNGGGFFADVGTVAKEAFKGAADNAGESPLTAIGGFVIGAVKGIQKVT